MTRRPLSRLEDHPNLKEILGVLAQLANVRDSDLPRLAAAWGNDATTAVARDRALSPDSPLVLEVLSAFEAVTALFHDDLAGEAAYVTLDPAVTTRALKAMRDAICGSYARPVLSRSQHAALLRPWRSLYPAQSSAQEPDLGPQGAAIQALLDALPRLAARCHDHEARALYDTLSDLSFVGESDRASARESAFQAAVVTSRRRMWALVKRSAAEGISRPCRSCRQPADPRDTARVLDLCQDAACALLVADMVSDELVGVLTSPVTALIPAQRR
jgi:hypothetical protein